MNYLHYLNKIESDEIMKISIKHLLIDYKISGNVVVFEDGKAKKTYQE